MRSALVSVPRAPLSLSPFNPLPTPVKFSSSNHIFTNMSEPEITLYGTDLSQPCRTVSWLLRLKSIPFTYIRTVPPQQTRTPEFEKLWVGKTIPVLQEGEVVLGEAHAIAVYLCETKGWSDLYPLGSSREDVVTRARILQWLNYHHRNSREFSLALLTPVLRPDLKQTDQEIASQFKTAEKVAKDLELYLSQHTFLAQTSTPTIADIAIYADVGQCFELNLFDFSKMPNLKRWFGELRKLKGWEETHGSMMKLDKAVKRYLEGKKAAKI